MVPPGAAAAPSSIDGTACEPTVPTPGFNTQVGEPRVGAGYGVAHPLTRAGGIVRSRVPTGEHGAALERVGEKEREGKGDGGGDFEIPILSVIKCSAIKSNTTICNPGDNTTAGGRTGNAITCRAGARSRTRSRAKVREQEQEQGQEQEY